MPYYPVQPGNVNIGSTPPSHQNSQERGNNNEVTEHLYITPTKWYPLPVAVGALLLIVLQYRRTRRSEKEVHVDEDGQGVVKLKGPWQVHVLGALPLNSLSRVWGFLNSLELPVWFRPFGFKLYSWAFGCNLDEINPPDLTQYASLGEFFYRKLKPGARPVADTVLVRRCAPVLRKP
ncbi:hypothetical protein EVJ58_g9576 [Rhodofomes roseus]|uniref:Uncharacterized protein n=1 Tax=Rhodofomes roseus TaxID=34475 RepID=A0A4Y9XSU3_9APHY|nr:hypothetical protein EVJ58_g9576 [Rhodofomes roseus]